MVNKIWIFLFIIGITYAIFTGRAATINEAILSSPKASIEMILNLTGLFILWNGLLQVAKDCGLISAFARLIHPVTRFLFPELPKQHEVHGLIASNMAANMLGLGSVATPLGIKAMKEMKKINGDKDHATRSMITLLLINTSSLTLIPTTIVSMRKINGSINPSNVIPMIILATSLSTFFAIVVDRLFAKLSKK
ncbi:nucleoside recognition domain-containing protein [Haloplasma contractile]|nr:nucleoside recognition domain-containing protein [Haloplasma contractile]